MKVLTRILHLFLTILILSCGSKEIFVPAKYQKEYLIFGNGGGFTGAVTTFYVLTDGRVFKEGATSGSPEILGKLDKSMTSQLFESYDNLNFNEIKIDDPGNIYFFISLGNTANRLTWGGNKQQVPQGLSTFHSNLSKLVKNLTEQSSKK